ncbi:hypothetical protein SAMN02744133_12012 [Thalassospira xiamenensis M-5 = DSM 17429]|nr:DUF5677 domain-containing protein [Thalassospira xiamenensis]SIT31570.1 hypothetical protein SAMN02744133_12012 [Thalassospira xiamenensis M-5 = DSM 17429]
MKKRNANKRKSGKKFPVHPDFKDRNITPIDSLKRSGKTLGNAFSSITSDLKFISWVDESIPNMIWACILTSFLEQKDYLNIFRAIVINARKNIAERKSLHITHNFLGAMNEDTFDRLMQPVLEHPQALIWLKGLLLLDCLPDRHHWRRHLDEPDPEKDWNILIHAVADNYDHQSQRATDIRWFKLIYVMLCREQIFLPEGSDIGEQLRLYPDFGDMRSVRPMIRSMEISLRELDKNGTLDGKKREEDTLEIVKFHADDFWSETLRKVDCISVPKGEKIECGPRELSKELIEIFQKIDSHFFETLSTTSIDPRHDGAFGIALYAITFLLNSAVGYSSSRPEGRVLLRTIAETYITLHYLTEKDDPALWQKYRHYGAGQTKLAFLKYLRETDVPDFIDMGMMEYLANEDMWLEFQDIDLGNWASLDLRKMSTEAGCKDVYDNYYDWTSGFSHGHWGAVRDSVFTNCLNPLHRYHRIPSFPDEAMPSMLVDGCKLCNRILDDLNRLYPSLKVRIKWHNRKTGVEKQA